MVIKVSYRHALALLVGCVVLGTLLGLGETELAAEDEPRESAVCLDCHAGRDTTLAGSAHALGVHGKEPVPRVACTDCHGADRRHWEESPADYPMTNPSKSSAAAEAKRCASCHQNAHQQNMRERNVHAASEVNCSGCHGVHGNADPALLKQPERSLCLGCHGGVEAEFARSYRHPVAEGVVKCSDCHLTLDETRRELTLSGSNVCMKCHGEFEGPFPHEHQATLDYSTEEGGCLSCHEPHGSHLPRMLKQPYQGPHFQLCTQCHSVPPGHNANANHGTAWAGMPCNDCHTDIHGSYDNRLFLSESVRSQGCLDAGCHGH